MISLTGKFSSVSFGDPAISFDADEERNKVFFEKVFAIGACPIRIRVTPHSAPNEPRKNTIHTRNAQDITGYADLSLEGTFSFLGIELPDEEFQALRGWCSAAAARDAEFEFCFQADVEREDVDRKVWRIVGETRVSMRFL